jgi:farnesyl diphosphate synthase
MMITNKPSLQELMETCPSRLQKTYTSYLHDVPSLDLKTAMEHSLLNPGKHIRPLLIYATGAIFNAPIETLDVPACAVELIHTYSLIHDDLPCMDNADLRRGKPTCHKLYGEGIAVLTGDALHTLAMQIMATHSANIKAERRLRMMNVLTQACGPFGMAAGQTLDITVLSDASISPTLLDTIYHLKTGRLISACIELGRLCSTDEDEANQHALNRLGQQVGLAFQIQDDIIDIETQSAQSGKTQGIDASNHKVTYPKMHGLAEAKDKVQMLYHEALEEINFLGSRAQLLRELIGQMLSRNK